MTIKDLESCVAKLVSVNKCQKKQLLQSLWSDYGEISRFTTDESFSDPLGASNSFIVKVIRPPLEVNHPRGWSSDFSHQRKLRSYQVEANFYQSWAPLCDENCRVPSLIAKQTFVDKTQALSISMIAMTDLDAAGFSNRSNQLSPTQTKVVLRWLAHFHAKFLNVSKVEIGKQLWPIGTYWHLATRMQEFNLMPDSELKSLANKIDKLLNNCKYMTVVHGDAKVANFCFSADFKHVAAVDFQYVGCGIGVKDVIYLLGSCLSEIQLMHNFESLMNVYFDYLQQAITFYQPEIDPIAVCDEWKNHTDLAWADFERFLVGWAAEHPKRNQFSQAITARAIAKISKTL